MEMQEQGARRKAVVTELMCKVSLAIVVVLMATLVVLYYIAN